MTCMLIYVYNLNMFAFLGIPLIRFYWENFCWHKIKENIASVCKSFLRLSHKCVMKENMNHAVRKRVLRVSSRKVLNFLSLHDAKAQSQSLSPKFTFEDVFVCCCSCRCSRYILLAFFDKYRDTLRRVCGRKSYWPWQESIKWAALHCGMLMMMMQCVSPTSKRRWPSAIKLCIICRYFLCSIYS